MGMNHLLNGMILQVVSHFGPWKFKSLETLIFPTLYVAPPKFKGWPLAESIPETNSQKHLKIDV